VTAGGALPAVGATDDGTVVYRPSGTIIADDGAAVFATPYTLVKGNIVLANVKGLRFSPDTLRMSVNSPGGRVHVIGVLTDGSDGPDVTADPKLQIGEPGDVAKVEMTADGPVFKAVKQGQANVTAKLGDLTSIAPLVVDVGGEVAAAGGGRLVVAPDPLILWSGETGRLGSVRVDPGNGQTSMPVEYKVTVPEGQGVVSVDGDKIRGLAVGNSQLTVVPVDPQFQGLSATVSVQVGAADKLSIEPADITLQVGETTPLVAVSAKGPDGAAYQAPALVESQDASVLVATPENPGHFLAKAPGRTQLKANYKGVDVFSTVTVSGKRFAEVKTTPNAGEKDFDVTVEVLAASSEGPLEYRVYVAGETPPENWVANQPQGDQRRAVLQSPRLSYGAAGSLYHLVIEARDTATKTVQQYPLTFRSRITVEREEKEK
jgi:hypothetical protein